MPDASSSGVFALTDDQLVALRQLPYDAESVLQGLIARFPQLIANDAEETWLLIRQEAGLMMGDLGESTGWLDHLFVDGDGVPTLVEVKRSSDTRIRREVVAQMLDYAANARHAWGGATLRGWFEERCASDGVDARAELFAAFPRVESADEYWATVRTNLEADRLRLVFVADEVPASLRRIVEYLNRRMTETEVLAVEVRQFVDETGAHTMLVPTVLGATEQARATKRSGGVRSNRLWEPEDVVAHLHAEGHEREAAASSQLAEWLAANGWKVLRGGGSTMGSFTAAVPFDSRQAVVFSVWTTRVVEAAFQHIRRSPSFESDKARTRLLEQLNAIDGIELPTDSIHRRPNFPLAVLAEDANLAAFVEVMARVADAVRRGSTFA